MYDHEGVLHPLNTQGIQWGDLVDHFQEYGDVGNRVLKLLNNSCLLTFVAWNWRNV